MKRTLLFSLLMLAATSLAWAGDGTMAAGYSLPKEWKKVKYPKHESLPDAVIQWGTVTLRARVLGYRADAPMSLHIEGFMPIDKSRLTEASRAILHMEAEGDYVDWVTVFEEKYLRLLVTAGLMKQPQPDEYRAVVADLHSLLPQEVQDTVTLRPADFETLTRPYAPVSPVFWDFCQVGGEGIHPYTTDLLYTPSVRQHPGHGAHSSRPCEVSLTTLQKQHRYV